MFCLRRTGRSWRRMQPSHELHWAFLHSEKALPRTALTFISTVVQSTNSSGVCRSNKPHQMAASCSLGTSVEKRCSLMCSELPSQQHLEVFHHLQAELLGGTFKKKWEYGFTSYQFCTQNSWRYVALHVCVALKGVQLLLCSSIVICPCSSSFQLR